MDYKWIMDSGNLFYLLPICFQKSRKFTILILGIFLLVLANACSSSVQIKERKQGFYYWQTILQLTSDELKLMDSLQMDQLYVRLFDVDTSRDVNNAIKIKPISILQLKTAIPKRLSFKPVVYITRSALKECTQVDSLAHHIGKLVQAIVENNHLTYSEIQWDCDWTPSTQSTYFLLLQKLKQEPEFEHKIFSATIRLHQIKNRSLAGIPPVDKGLVMCYNMGNLKRYGEQNSIIDLPTAKEYLGSMQSYPLKLDIALPLFHWALQFRNEKFVGILNDVESKDVLDNIHFTQKSKCLFIAKETTTVNGFSIQAHDEIRLEFVDLQVLHQMAKYLSRHNNNTNLQVLFFHLSPTVIKTYPAHELQTILDCFQ